ncbi:MAG: RNA-binding protein [Rhodospirillales bacterium]|nr:RNA-binding protein [Rhodospirillales bacterium]MDE0380793.1 RNA-binding protein [Rhodospirillales bacterium]
MRDRRDSSDAGARRCIASGASRPRDELLRFVVGPGGALVPDLGESLPGRGLWISAERALLAKACERGLFARAARRPIAMAPDLIDEVERQLTVRALDVLGLARRAGGLVTGFDKVERALVKRRVAVLVEASDGARHGRARLGALARDLPVIAHFDGAMLSRSLGRENVVHAALAPGRLADRFLRESARLAGVREETGDRDRA